MQYIIRVCGGRLPAQEIWSGIEVVITALTRNQVTGNRPWVRIPPAPLSVNPDLTASDPGFCFVCALTTVLIADIIIHV